jgi:hypothetical protein
MAERFGLQGEALFLRFVHFICCNGANIAQSATFAGKIGLVFIRYADQNNLPQRCMAAS